MENLIVNVIGVPPLMAGMAMEGEGEGEGSDPVVLNGDVVMAVNEVGLVLIPNHVLPVVVPE